jgi:hypothetical protein
MSLCYSNTLRTDVQAATIWAYAKLYDIECVERFAMAELACICLQPVWNNSPTANQSHSSSKATLTKAKQSTRPLLTRLCHSTSFARSGCSGNIRIVAGVTLQADS